MMLTSARLTLKQHRFEIGAALVAAVAIGAAALIVVQHLQATNVPPGCFDAWLTSGGEGAGDCDAPVRAFAAINEEEAGKVFAAMAVLPFLVGLLGGVPIIGRELESRTAQTAWSLSGSRIRWLVRQLVPVAIVLGVAVTFAALAADLLETTRAPWYNSAYSDLDLHGLPVVARAFAALGIGLLVGALVGRTLPAFIVGAVLSLGVVYGAGSLQSTWLDGQQTVVIDEPGGGGGMFTGQTWLGPDGAQVPDEEVTSAVPAGVTEPDTWLLDHGYRLVEIGIPGAVVLQWVPYEAIGFGLVGLGSLLAGAVVVNRRRPT
jgi:hypothetical protein